MDYYEVRWKHSAEKDLRKIHPQQIPRIINAVEKLAKNPFPSQSCKLQKARYLYRLRVGNYRVIYHVDTFEKLVTIYYVRHRKEAY